MGKGHVRAFSPFTFSRVFLSTEPASLVAIHMKSPLWLADAELIRRAPSSLTKNSDCSGWISRPFLNQRIFGRGEPECTGTTKWVNLRFCLGSAMGCPAHLQQARCDVQRRCLQDNLKRIKIYYQAATRFKNTTGSVHSSKSDWDKTGVFLLITGCTGAANDWEEKARDHGSLYSTQQKQNMSGDFSSLDDLIWFPKNYIQFQIHIDKTASLVHNTTQSTVPFCTYVYSYGLLRKIHCLIVRRKCIQMFCFRCLIDLIKGHWIYSYGPKKIISYLCVCVCVSTIITSITCHVFKEN